MFLVAGSSWAIPMSELNFDQDYWTLTDLTTGLNGESTFTLTFEDASYESDFGLYTVDDVSDPKAISEKFMVFDKSKEPNTTIDGPTMQSVYFKKESGAWSVSLDSSDWTPFDSKFGFYFGVYTSGAQDQMVDYLWFTDTQFNQLGNGSRQDQYVEHIGTIWDGISNVKIYLDDKSGGGDRDFNDMVVVANDLQPVPEPATMLLLGVGLCGIAFVGRKKLIRHGWKVKG